MNWGGEESSRLKLLDDTRPRGADPRLADFAGRLESRARGRAKGLEVLANGEEALAKEKCACAHAGAHTVS